MSRYTIVITGTATDVSAIEDDVAAFAELLRERGRVTRARVQRYGATPLLAPEDAPAATAALAQRLAAVGEQRAVELEEKSERAKGRGGGKQ